MVISTKQKEKSLSRNNEELSLKIQEEPIDRHPDAILKVGGPKFPNGGACPMVLLGGILF